MSDLEKGGNVFENSEPKTPGQTRRVSALDINMPGHQERHERMLPQRPRAFSDEEAFDSTRGLLVPDSAQKSIL